MKIMSQDISRWALPDLEQAVAWCRQKNHGRIRYLLHNLLPYATTRAQASGGLAANLSCLDAIAANRIDASISIKLSTLGAGIDRAVCRKHAVSLAEAAAEREIRLEIDMEGKGLLEFTFGTAIALAEAGHSPTIAIQAYFDRSGADLRHLLAAGIRPRIVKGAYLGDTGDFADIQERFRELASTTAGYGSAFSAGTHDPDLIRWLQDRFAKSRDRIEFGFLFGLADATKQRLAGDGWKVSEYVPFGEAARAYTLRRLRYLENLAAIHRQPAP
jgi:proline dehydrogenase